LVFGVNNILVPSQFSFGYKASMNARPNMYLCALNNKWLSGLPY
jgi:hypothetical protein